MIEETALVTSVEGQFARVEAQRSSTCGHCQSGPACGTSLLGKLFGNRRVTVKALNPINAVPGEQVVVGVAESTLIQASVGFYLLPVLLLILLAAGGRWFAETTDLIATEPASIFGGLLGLLAGLSWIRYNAGKNRPEACQAVILRRTSRFNVVVGN